MVLGCDLGGVISKVRLSLREVWVLRKVRDVDWVL